MRRHKPIHRRRRGISRPAAVMLCCAVGLLGLARAGGEEAAQRLVDNLADST